MSVAEKVRNMRDIGALRGACTTDAKAEHLLGFLARYAAANKGATPSYAVMGSELGVPVEAVRILLSRLENRGKVHFISKSPPRIMLVGPDTVLPHEPTAADLAAAKPGAFGRYLDAEAERMRLGRFIATTEQTSGHGPSLNAMVDFVGWAAPARVGRMAEMLAEKGLIQFGRGVPTRLTALGKQFYGVKEQKMEQEKQPVIIYKARTPRKAMVAKMCEALANHLRTGGDNYIRYNDLGLAIGYSGNASAAISELARAAMHAGYIEPKLPKHHGLFFTAKGRAKFMPETVTAAPSEAPRNTMEDYMAEIDADKPPLRTPPRQEVYAAAPAPGAISLFDTATLIMELVERGYTVRK